LLGLAAKAFGVELGPQRFALGCRALENLPRAARVPSRPVSQAHSLELVHGDARDWPRLAKQHGWPECSSRWAVFLGAECFRDSLLSAISQALLHGCAVGARIAVLGRRFPTEVAAASGPRLQEIGFVRARTTWSSGADVFLYKVMLGTA